MTTGRGRWVSFAGGIFVLAALMTVQAWRLGQPLVTAAACIAFLCSVYVTSYALHPSHYELDPADMLEDALDQLRRERYNVFLDVDLGTGPLGHLLSGANGAFLVAPQLEGDPPIAVAVLRERASLLSEELRSLVTPVICTANGDAASTRGLVLTTGCANFAESIRTYPAVSHVDRTTLARFATRLA